MEGSRRSDTTERVMISGLKSSWRLVICGIPQELILGSLLLNIFINDMSDRGKHTPSKFEKNVKLGGVVNTPELRCLSERFQHADGTG